jgi:hypothetical protein
MFDFAPDDEAARKAAFKRAGEIMRGWERGEGVELLPRGDPRRDDLLLVLPAITANAAARAPWDMLRAETEAAMIELARSLPVHAWVKEHAKGVGDLGLARLIGEAPKIGLYDTHANLWKHMGVAVIGGERQQKRTGTLGLEHGYAPRRRAELWSVCSDVMLRSQWRGADDDDPDAQGMPIGPYGAVYFQRKQQTLSRIADTADLPHSDRRKWTRKRCDADARRVMSKEFLRDLWLVWHGKEARQPSRFAQQSSEAIICVNTNRASPRRRRAATSSVETHDAS